MSSYEYVPIIGEMMAVRWSFEALAVEQFKNNKYLKNLFIYNQEISQNEWYTMFLIKALKADLNECIMKKDSLNFRGIVKDDFYKLNYYIEKLSTLAGYSPMNEDLKASMSIEKFTPLVAKKVEKYLDSLDLQIRHFRKEARDRKDSVENSIKSQIGKEEYIRLKDNYHNKNLEMLVLDQTRLDQYIETPNRIIQMYEPGYMKPLSKNGRAHFYAPYKQIGDIKIDTYWFDLMILWTVTLALYIALYFNIFEKLITVLTNLRLKESDK
jgi:hypothetical protein